MITIDTIDTIPIFKKLKYNINTGFQLIIAEVGDMSVTVLDKFLQNVSFYARIVQTSGFS